MVDVKAEVKKIILELEEKGNVFSEEDIIEKARMIDIDKHDAEAEVEDLIESNYIRRVPGSEGLLERTVWRNYSPAFEDPLELF